MMLSYVPLHRALLIALVLAIARPIDGTAQTSIIADSSGIGTTVAFAGTTYTITGGSTDVSNLFHSFSRFNVPPGGTAHFTVPTTITNVISRVMGEASLIQGIIRTRTPTATPSSANFFLINPLGVTFGAGAALDVGGAFRVSTADYVALGADGAFSAHPEKATVLSSAAPTAFGFLSSPAPVTVNSTLQVGSGRTLSVVGGNVEVSGGTAARVLAPGGLVQIASVSAASVASPVEASFSVNDLGFAPSVQYGAVNISGGAAVQAANGGTVVIRSGRLTIDQASVSVTTGAAAGPAVGLDLRATESIVVRGTSGLVRTQAASGSGSGLAITTGNLSVTDGGLIESLAVLAGNGGHIDITAETVNLVNGRIRTSSNPSRAGDISINASGTVSLTGATAEISTVKNTAQPLSVSNPILAGNISVNARDLVLEDGAKIQSGTRTAGRVAGESINITATNAISISGLAGISSQSSRTAGAINISAPQLSMDMGYINASTHSVGTAGQVAINANTVSLTNGAQIGSSSQLGTPGAGGTITISAPGSVTISGTAPGAGVGDLTFSGSAQSGIFSTAGGSGNAGQIAITTPVLTVTGEGRITVVTTAAGKAGAIAATVGNFALTGGGRIESSTIAAGAGGAITLIATEAGTIAGSGSGVFSTASDVGSAGQIAITAPVLTMTDGAKISAATAGTGSAGTITIDAGTTALSGGARVDTSTSAGGAGGGLIVSGTGGTSSVSIAGSGTGLFSTASSDGNAGEIRVTADNVLVTTGGTVDSSTTGAGAGGAINVTAAGQVEIVDGGTIKADSLGSGVTGNVIVSAGDQIVMTDGSISTRAVTSDGGNITLMAPNVIRLKDSQITTSVESGTGAGGNIFIDPQLVIFEGSSVTANAFGGPGGNITIIANSFIADGTSVVEASSALSAPGTVQKPENNIAADIAQLPGELVDASRLLQGACSARRAGAPSSFTVAGRGGVPVDPDGYLPSFVASGGPFAAVPSAAAGQRLALAMAGWDCWR